MNLINRPTVAVLFCLLALCAYTGATRADEAGQAAKSATRTFATNPVLAERHETAEEHDARMAWFRDAHFGMFIHWGSYAQAGGDWKGRPTRGAGEWIIHDLRIPIADYATLAKDFNPTNYDAEKWVLAAKDAGMKYIVITAKHHEGFAMFKTAATPYNIVDATPFARDPLADLAAACKKHGIKLGFYYSQNLDWHHPGGGDGGWDPAHKGDSDQYVDNIVIPQLREILTHYGEISVLWFDIPGGVINKARADRIQKAVLECNPKILMNNRLGGGYHGDTQTPEQFVPANGFPGLDWETCMTMNNTWGFKKQDHAWKSSTEMVRMLCDATSKGGNYLLNVGPTPLGEIPQPSLERLKEIGNWTRINGEAIYGTTGSPFPQAMPWGKVTVRGSRLYLCVFDPPKNGQLTLHGLATELKSAHFLTDKDHKELAVAVNADGDPAITLPPDATWDPAATVVVAELAGEPVVDYVVRMDPKTFSAVLKPQDAVLGRVASNVAGLQEAASIKVDGDHIGYWSNPAETIQWKCAGVKAGAYHVVIEGSCPESEAGSEVALLADGAQVGSFTVDATGGWGKFAEGKTIAIELPRDGTVVFTLKPLSKKHGAIMNVRQVKIAKP